MNGWTEDDQRVGEIVAWFFERDILLGFNSAPDGTIRAVMVPADSRIAPARSGTGASKLEAAEDAKARYERGEVTWPVGASAAMPYEVLRPVSTGVSMPFEVQGADEGTATDEATVEARLTGEDHGTATESASVVKHDDQEAAELVRVTRVATEYGWRIGFIDEPDETVTAYLMDQETAEVLKTASGSDFHDAVLELMGNTYPPSDDGRAN